MCKSASSKSTATSGSAAVWLSRLATTALILYTLGFILFRIAEIVISYLAYPQQWHSALLGTLVLHFTLMKGHNRRGGRFMLHCASMAMLVYILDHHIPNPLPDAVNNDESSVFAGMRVVITGANAGVGYETSRRLAVEYGVDVIMGCRSHKKCENAANSITEEIVKEGSVGSVTPAIIDLSDLESVKSFASQLINNDEQKEQIDVLFNNAGYAPSTNLPVNDYGLDPSFTSMHLAHFYLTELLIESNPQLRVVNTASGTHHLCAIPFATIPSFILNAIPPSTRKYFAFEQSPGCIDEEYLQTGIRSPTTTAAYIEAKLANIMHIVELNRRHPRAQGVAIDLGWVGTKIQPWMQIGPSPTNLGWMRHATTGVVPMLHAILSTDEQLVENSAKNGNNDANTNNNNNIEIMNVFGQTEEAFTKFWWNGGGVFNNQNYDLGRKRMVEMCAKLWEESENILKANGYYQ